MLFNSAFKIRVALNLNDLFCVWDTYYNEKSYDLYFVGIKKGDNDILDLTKYTSDYVLHTKASLCENITN